jgi:hypothetical protein
MSIGILFKAGSLTPDDGRLISKQFGRNENEHYWMLSRFTSGRLRFRLRTGGSVTTLISSQSNLYKSGEWVFAVATYDGSLMRLYCNGMEVGRVAKSGMIDADSSINAYIGAALDQKMLSATFDGKIDYAFVYDRDLSGDEISQLNSNGQALVASELDPGDSVDTIVPTVNIISPSSTGSFETSDSAVNLTGTASDNVGVTQVAWSSDRGGSGTASGTTSWEVSNIQLSAGTNILTFTADDAAGNHASKTLTVIYSAPPTVVVDQVAPMVRIVSPTSRSNYFSRIRSVDLAGTAFDNTQVAKITWKNSRGETGTASGTQNWDVAGVPLNRWRNTITITAHDLAGNSSSANLRVFCWR